MIKKTVKHVPIVYIDGENTLYRIAEVLIKANLIQQRDEIVNFNFRKLLSSVIGADDLDIRYYGTKIKVIKKPPSIHKKTKHIIAIQRQVTTH